MDLQVAIFLLIFLSLSSLATLGICYVEIRSCWRNYRMRKTQKTRGDELAYLEEQSGLQPVVDLANHEMHEIIGEIEKKIYFPIDLT